MARTWNPLTWLAVALVVAIGLMVVLGTLAMTAYGGYAGMMGGAWGWGIVMMAVPGAILVVILVAALGGLERPPQPAVGGIPGARPLAILDERYARGELSREDYLRARADLESGPTQS